MWREACSGTARGGGEGMFWLRIAAVGLGYFGAQVTWALYNAFLPLLYAPFLASELLIGLAMVIDNVAALTLQPAFAAFSDRTWTRWAGACPTWS